MKSSDALRAANLIPLPRWWVRESDMAQIKAYADAVSEEVTAIRKKANKGAGKKPAFLQPKENQEAIDRMWHIINDRSLRDGDKLDIIYSELHKRKSS